MSLIACEAPIKEVVRESYPNNQAKLIEYVQDIAGEEVVVDQKTYFENGQFKMGGKLEDGKREGMWVAYFENGNLQSKGDFKAGNRDGIAMVYYPNTQLMYKGQYKKDKKVGAWKFYNKQGELVKEEDFK